MVRLNLREVEQNADFSYLDYWKSIQNGSFIFFLGNTRDQAAACFAFLPKSFQESNIRTNKTSYASNSVYFEGLQQSNSLTSISLSHTLAHSNGSRHSSVRFNRSVGKQDQTVFDL